MKIKTHLFKIEIKPTDYFGEGVKEDETFRFGSKIVKLLLEEGTSITNINIEYSKEENENK
ncbi:MAG: hypothetical protein KAQ92_05830 [Candidatus Aenigmarchaeota archaeon]|nr:hypothetical protein [Candidatus Aenigmarchaeota archaeon]